MSWQTALAITSVALAPVLGLVGIVYGTRSQAKRDREARERELEQERKRWEREDRLERERAARERQAKWADRRLAAHEKVIERSREWADWCASTTSGSITTGTENPDADLTFQFVEHWSNMRTAMSALEPLVGTGVEKAVQNLAEARRTWLPTR